MKQEVETKEESQIVTAAEKEEPLKVRCWQRS
jgi:hypothetical protein